MTRAFIKDELIRHYNACAGTKFRCSFEANQNALERVLLEDESNYRDVKAHISNWVSKNRSEATSKKGFINCIWAYKMPETTSTTEVPVEASKTADSQVSDQQVQYSMGILEKAVIGLISQTQTESIEKRIFDSLGDRINKFINENYGPITRKIQTVIDGKEYKAEGVLHEQFDTIVKFVANDIPVYLYGPAGSGKNHICKQVADALGLDFYYSGAVTQEYKLTGFTDANGNYQETEFYRAVKNGGLFMLDEMDASIPEVLVILNACIANGYFDFPAPIGFVKAHPNFKVIAAGNTLGHGADSEYSGRYQLDAATLNRFAAIPLNYSPAIEMAVGKGNAELVNFCREFRKSARDNGLPVVVSYRQISMMATMENLLSLKETISTCLLKGLEKDDVNLIANNLKSSKYTSALKEVVASM